MFPKLALLDPSLTESLPWEQTLFTGLDALCQALESIWNRNANALTQSYATMAAKLAWEALSQGRTILNSPTLRSMMMEASLLAGLAISQTRTALCHSISYPITAHYGVPHGLACGVWMPAVLKFNSANDDGRLHRIAHNLGFSSSSHLADGLELLLQTTGAWARFHDYIQDRGDLTRFISEMITPGRIDNNLRDVSTVQIKSILLERLKKRRVQPAKE
jgi:alcohol dehydrogenase